MGLNKSAKINHQYAENKANNVTVTTTTETNTYTTATTTMTNISKSKTITTTSKNSTQTSTTTSTTMETYSNSNKTTVKTPTQSVTTSNSQISNGDNNYISMEVPQGNTNFFAYMDYKTITNISSNQYKLQEYCWTDSQGIRRQGDDYCVALGSYYSTNIGDRFVITLDTGNTYTVVLADCKADIHTDVNNQFRWARTYKNVIEFIVDSDKLSNDVRNSGNMGTYDNLNGNIVSIQKIVETGDK